MSTFFDCLLERHDPRLVALAAVICLLACFTVSALLARAQAARDSRRWLWTGIASVEFGCGVWSLHFVAMLAFMPGMPIRYRLAATAWSVAVAVIGSGLGFALICLGRRDAWTIGGAAAALTLAIGGMHYAGISAMRMEGKLSINPGPVALSFGLCLASCALAVASTARLDTVGRQLRTALLLSCAVCGLHFVGMSGLEIRMGRSAEVTGGLLGSGSLALVVAVSSIALVLLSLALSIMDRLLQDRATIEKQRLRKLTAVSFEGLLVVQDGFVVDANEQLEAFSGRALVDVVGQPLQVILPSAVDHQGLIMLETAGTDHVLRRADGTTMPVELLMRSIVLDHGASTAIAVRDLTSRRASEAALHRLAHHDPLTGLANRSLLDLQMRRALGKGPSAARGGAVLCLDLDRFKPVNDLFGHAAGDQVLTSTAARLGALLAPSDTLARLGGDEFVIWLPRTADTARCRGLADQIVASMLEPFGLDGQQVCVGVSIGIALWPQDGETPDDLLRCADIAMYRAKGEGRGTYRFFEMRMDAELQRRRSLELDLKDALRRRLLEVFYQPLVGSATREVEGFEALLRWRHPTRGYVSPSEFIPIAEESGLIVPLGLWALESACRAATLWRGDHRLAVNLSPTQFKQRSLVDDIADILGRTGLSSARLEIEITESVLIDDPERAAAVLAELRGFGVRVSLDDFGTGYSSLSYLRQFPLDKIKIDRSFVRDLGSDGRSAAIVRAIVALAHSLDMSVTAEGVETEEQFEALQLQGCHQVQGFLLGKPAPIGHFPIVLDRAKARSSLPLPA